MQPSSPRDQAVARAKIQMIRIAQQDLDAEALEIAVRDAFHGALSADRHERRRFDLAVRRGHDTAPSPSVGFGDPEAEYR